MYRPGRSVSGRHRDSFLVKPSSAVTEKYAPFFGAQLQPNLEQNSRDFRSDQDNFVFRAGQKIKLFRLASLGAGSVGGEVALSETRVFLSAFCSK